MTDPDDTPAKRPTIYDLAQIAGTSASAVSSVLNGTWKKRRISVTLAERISLIAAEQGYAVNRQASLLRRERSHIIGMIVPKYDNRYFGAIAEQFEAMARARDLFPVITCTLRDPDLEFEAARELVSYQAECLIVTGATDPDRIADFCAAAGVRVINLDLPGNRAPSVVSNNFAAARDLTGLVLTRLARDFGAPAPLWFIGGRSTDHNTRERLRGFRQAHADIGLSVPDAQIVMPGYSPQKATAALSGRAPSPRCGMFVNSTISLEGVIRWLNDQPAGLSRTVRLGCFDWDPFAALLPQTVGMIEQNVAGMMSSVFDMVEKAPSVATTIEVACIMRPLDNIAA